MTHTSHLFSSSLLYGDRFTLFMSVSCDEKLNSLVKKPMDKLLLDYIFGEGRYVSMQQIGDNVIVSYNENNNSLHMHTTTVTDWNKTMAEMRRLLQASKPVA